MNKPLDLNDLRYFSAIIDAGSLSAASRNLGVTKSLLSLHLAKLEQTLGVTLIQRTTRRMEVTPLGQEFHHRCQAVLAEVERAQSLIEDARDVARGTLKISCPVAFAQVILTPMLSAFLQAYPEVNLVLDADYRDVDLLSEGYDLALKVQRQLDDSRFIVRSFRMDQLWLVATPELATRLGPVHRPSQLDGVASVLLRYPGDNPNGTTWQLFDANEQAHPISHQSRLASSDPLVLKPAVLSGLGVALLPSSLCQHDVRDGLLVRLLPNFHGGNMQLHAVFPSRQGLSKAARCFLEHLGQHLPMQIQQMLDED